MTDIKFESKYKLPVAGVEIKAVKLRKTEISQYTPFAKIPIHPSVHWWEGHAYMGHHPPKSFKAHSSMKARFF